MMRRTGNGLILLVKKKESEVNEKDGKGIIGSTGSFSRHHRVD